jgi:dihydropteroate synthase
MIFGRLRSPESFEDGVLRLVCGKYALALERPLVMGIVNVTPDSFSDAGKHFDRRAAIAHARRLIENGADILDIGGESTRPGARLASLGEELDRVIPVIEAVAGAGVPISIDTQKPEVMHLAIVAGACIVNDVNALQAPGALQAIVGSKVAVCLMHRKGSAETMQQNPEYRDVVAEVKEFLRERAEAVLATGVAAERIIIDPGFGFGKTVAHNLRLLRDLDAFLDLGFPVMAGLSRKSTLGTITGRPVNERLAASLAAALLAAQKGAKIIRVHDVRETVDVLKILQAVG